MILSPITQGATTLVTKLSVNPLIAYYKSYDVTPLFHGLKEFELRECNDTGYKFYFPYTLAGDDAFYQHLSKEMLYYIPWKWEHGIANTYTKSGDTVLEQGCANGDFLVKLKQEKNISPFGTELNTEAKAIATSKGVSFETTTSADVVCSFQVLEHIADVQSYMDEAIQSVKTGGYIIFGVPNNDALVRDDNRGYLNMPPHHMGLWREQVFRKLPNYFPLEFVTSHKEILQPHHYRYYYQIHFGDRFLSLGFIGKVFNKLVYLLIAKWWITYKAPHITGHTIVAVFKKI